MAMNQSHIDTLGLDLIRVLKVLLEERNVTQAGIRLGISQSAVSHSLRRLREQLGDDLLVRTSRGMVPTARGNEIAAALPSAFANLEAALTESTFTPQSSRRIFTIVAGAYARAVLLKPLMQRVLHEGPGLHIELRDHFHDMFESVHRGEVDIIIARHAENTGGLHQERLFTEPFVWVMRTRNPNARGPLTFTRLASMSHVVIKLRSLTDHYDPMRRPFGLTDEIDLGAFRRELLKRGLRQNVGMIVPDTQSALDMARTTDMAALVARRLALAHLPKNALRIFKPPYSSPEMPMGFLARPDRLAAPDLLWLIRQVRNTAAAIAA